MKLTEIVEGATYEIEYHGFHKARCAFKTPMLTFEILDGPRSGERIYTLKPRQVLREIGAGPESGRPARSAPVTRPETGAIALMVRPRGNPPHDGDYLVEATNLKQWDCGRTPAEAIGKWILAHGREYGIAIVEAPKLRD